MPSHSIKRCLRNEYAFGAELIRLAFGIIFVVAAWQKIKMGIPAFAEMLSSQQTPLAQAVPSVVYTYAFMLPIAELIAGALLILHYHVKEAYIAVGFMYLTFTFGMMYDGNSQIVGTQYIPALVALALGMVLQVRSERP